MCLENNSREEAVYVVEWNGQHSDVNDRAWNYSEDATGKEQGREIGLTNR